MPPAPSAEPWIQELAGVLAQELPQPLSVERSRNLLQLVIMGGISLGDAVDGTLVRNRWAMQGHTLSGKTLGRVESVLERFQAAQGGA